MFTSLIVSGDWLRVFSNTQQTTTTEPPFECAPSVANETLLFVTQSKCYVTLISDATSIATISVA